MNTIDFNEIDLLFIKDYVNGVHLNKIKQKLNINTDEEILSIKQEVKNKLLVVSDLDMIKKAYELKLVVIDDCFLKNWRDFAFRTAYNIYLCRSRGQTKGDDLKLIYIKILRVYVLIFNTFDRCNKK